MSTSPLLPSPASLARFSACAALCRSVGCATRLRSPRCSWQRRLAALRRSKSNWYRRKNTYTGPVPRNTVRPSAAGVRSISAVGSAGGSSMLSLRRGGAPFGSPIAVSGLTAPGAPRGAAALPLPAGGSFANRFLIADARRTARPHGRDTTNTRPSRATSSSAASMSASPAPAPAPSALGVFRGDALPMLAKYAASGSRIASTMPTP
mmetsp:Transcript_27992/g.96749  ORF Transcript_27992/g.96749 Transcript_27992/m.96749 type:complete len:207 (+) Transcript_27992:873-1493(+)